MVESGETRAGEKDMDSDIVFTKRQGNPVSLSVWWFHSVRMGAPDETSLQVILTCGLRRGRIADFGGGVRFTVREPGGGYRRRRPQPRSVARR